MQFSTFLKKLLAEFVDVYKQYFSSTIKAALLWTILCFAIAQVIATYCNYDPGIKAQPVGILSFFILRFSYGDTYSFVDLIKTLFIFFVSIFSINLIRKIAVKDIIYLLGILIVCALLDCALFRLGVQLESSFNNNSHAIIWINGIIFLFRIYLPMILFALIVQLCLNNTQFNFKKILFLFVSLWLFNEVSYEFTMMVRANFFNLIMITLKPLTYRYVVESILGVPLIAFYFLGYYCAMTAPFRLLEEK